MTKKVSDTKEFKNFLDAWQKLLDAAYTGPLTPVVEFTVGRRYVRVIRQDVQRSVLGFIDNTTGDILKPAGWKGPAKHARGNIFNEDKGLGCIGAYGVASLR